MGLVVQFGLPVQKTRRTKPVRPCQITIFPGVRYERHDAAKPAEPPLAERLSDRRLEEQRP